MATPEDGKYLSAIENLIGSAIPRFEIEGIANETVAEGDGPGRRRGGRPRRERDASSEGRGGGRSRPKRESKPRDEKPKSPERPESRDEKPKTKAKAPAGRREQGAGGPSGPGLGDHMPAFLMRPARPKAKD